MKINFLFLLISSFSLAQVGINTDDPTNTLDVNGTLRVRKIEELSSRPTYILAPDNNGVISKIKTSSVVNQASNDSNSYRLKAVYSTNLNQAQISTDDTGVIIGGISNFKVNSAENFILFTTQNSTYLTPFSSSKPSISYRYNFFFDNLEVDRTAWESIQRDSFTDVCKNDGYQFILNNVSIGNHTLNVEAYRQKHEGVNRTLYFNTTTDIIEKKGSLVIYLYEK